MKVKPGSRTWLQTTHLLLGKHQAESPEAYERQRRRGRMFAGTALTGALLTLASSLPATAVDWTGAVSTDWFNAANWAGGVMPLAGQGATIDTTTPNPSVIAAPGAIVNSTTVGFNAIGSLTIKDGGTYSGGLFIGFNSGAQGTVIVTGVGSSVSAGTALIGIRTGSTGTAVIEKGGALTGVDITLGSAGGNGNLTVTDAGSILNASLVLGSSGGTGTMTVANGGTVVSALGSYIGVSDSGTVTVTGASSTWTSGGTISVGFAGTGMLTIANGGTVNVAAPLMVAEHAGSVGALNIGSPAGQAAVAPGTLNTTDVVFGAGTGAINFNHTSTSYLFAPVISGTGSVNVLSGTTILSAANTFTGATTVNGGTLSVNGTSTGSAVTVNAGGTLGGNGTVGNTTINGGALAPGNSIGLLTVQGSLVFTAASSYLVEVSPANADRTNVTGAATLGGATVNASFAAGTYVAKQYTILNATGGLGGSTFGSVVNTNLPGGFKSSLGYDANNAYLNLTLDFTPTPTPNFGSGLSGNQQAVGNALINFFNTTGGIPLVFGTLTPSGLTQISGETATGSQQSTFNAMNQFMGVMTDPFIAGRGDPVSGGGNPNAYAEESLAYAARGKSRSKSEQDAYAAIYTKAPPLAPAFEQRWSVWAAGFGGSQTTDGNTVAGSNNTRSSLAAGAVGADYRISPNTLAGFGLAGGGTSFSVNGAGSGRSDLFQAGALIRHNVGPAYITGALAYGWQDITTDRTVTVAGVDRLRAQFNANAWSGRIEGGYRFVSQGFGWTPYAAGQFTTFELPAYAEQVIVGANTFALAYDSRSVTNTRSELGLRTDKSFAMQNGIFTLRGRAAWAHDFNADRSIGATFQTLPGASFVVNGARQAADAALVTGSAEMKWINGWSTAATFEGEFSNVTRSYAGKGVVRYAW
jgi:T5SS/PEP-CTERM-associated repeat protein/autotransporter-associated beta strand protein